MKRDAGDDHTRPEEQRALDEQRLLIVQQVLPPLGRDEFGKDDGHVVPRLLDLQLVDVFLDPAEIERLFEPFYRGQALRSRLPGTGMGLAIVRGLLAAQGGRVWAQNLDPRGAAFSVAVPGRVLKVPEARHP